MTRTTISQKARRSQEVETELNKHLTLARVETNFEKLPIWSPKPKRGTTFVPSKTIELEPEKLPDGNIIERKIEIAPSAKYGYPTVQTQEYWYALQKLWHESPTKETGRIEFSRRQIIEDVLGKTYGRQTRRALDLSINQLGTTRFAFNYVFYDKVNDIIHREIKKFHLIIEENLTERKKQSEVIHDKCSVTLHPLIVSNLRSGYFKPILLSVVSQLKSDIARLLYRKLDSQFSYYSKYEISTERFFREHGLEGQEYVYSSARKRRLEKPLGELLERHTSSGAIIDSYEFIKTADGKDWKLIVRSSKKSKQTRKPIEQIDTTYKQPQIVEEAPKQTPQTQKYTRSEVDEILDHFLTRFFSNSSDVEFSKNDRKKATQLIDKYGKQKTLLIINYAKEATEKDRYYPKSLAGISKYIPGALKRIEESEKQKRVAKLHEEKLAQQHKENRRIDHQKKYSDAYIAYVESLLEALFYRSPQEYVAFEKSEQSKRAILEKALKDAPTQTKQSLAEVNLRVFDKRAQRVVRVVEFFKEKTTQIPDFWEWDKEVNSK